MNNIIPSGVNLLAMANKAIGFTPAIHKRWKQNDEDGEGIENPIYYPDEKISVSLQPVGRQLFQLLGLDLQKDYITVYSTADVKVRDLERNTGSDLVLFEGKTYQAESNTPWVNQNGWRGTICVSLGKTC